MRTTRARMAAMLALAALLAGPAAAQAPNTPDAAPSLPPDARRELTDLLSGPASWTTIDLFRNRLPRQASDTFSRMMLWNEVALDTTAIDHTPLVSGDIRPRFGEQFGPPRTSRAMAIVHIAMFEAVNAVHSRFESYVGLQRERDDLARERDDLSLDRAIAQAGHDTLLALYPAQQVRIDALLAQDVASLRGTPEELARGARLGARAAAAILARRHDDGSQLPEISVGTGPGDFHVTEKPGYWMPDPVSGERLTIGARWGLVTPFVLRQADQFRAPPPPALASHTFAVVYDNVLTLGGDPSYGTPTTRTERQTYIGRFWGYDGTPALCAPTRLYNMIARDVAVQTGMHEAPELARFLAMANTAMADAGISGWEAKYYYQFWRPVTGIRAGDTAGNPEINAVPNWYPLGAPATNTGGPNFTPPFPAYPSGHATFGGALFEVFRAYWPDDTHFTVISDEFNGHNRDVDGNIRPLIPETFASFRQAEYDNAESRIYNGVHWETDATAGIAQGNAVARYVMAHAFRRLADRDD